jgi:hypothetical protein
MKTFLCPSFCPVCLERSKGEEAWGKKVEGIKNGVKYFFVHTNSDSEKREKGLTKSWPNEFVQSHFSDGNLNPISNPTPP